jgi:tRNA-2-methylthio-N6-dimethylallyladenosine synthase
VAAGIADDVAPEDKQRRLAEIITLQRGISDESSKALIGSEVEVLVDGPSARRPDRVTGKTQTFRGAVFPGDESLRGSLVRMRVTASKGMTLEGEPVAVTTGAAQ